MKKIIHVVPHSHWDREWYFTLNDSNLMLGENLQHLLTTLEKDSNFPAYIFDGQYSVIDAYFQWHPEDEAKIRSLVKAKRLFIGPWYTQADTRLIHHESLVRNLLYGTRLSNKMGHTMKIGYLPDTFGQNAYLPSIFHEFSIDYSILQRGIYREELTTNNLNIRWKAPDGRSIATNYLYFGYGPGKFLEGTEAYFTDHLRPLLTKLITLNQDSNDILLPAGGDQVLVNSAFPDIVDQLNHLQKEYHFKLTDYERFMAQTWKKNHFTTVISNERMASEKTRIHRTIASQRYDIKKINSRVEYKLIQILEPLLVFTDFFSIFAYPEKQLDTIWKMLFDIHAHDSIGCCNSDTTNQAIKHRLESAEELIDGLQNISLKKMGTAISNSLNNDVFFLFNSSVKIRCEDVKVSLFSVHNNIQIVDTNTTVVLPFTSLRAEYISGGVVVKMTATGEKMVKQPGYYKHTLILADVKLQALNYRRLTIIPGKKMKLLIRTDEHQIENRMIKIAIFQNKLIYTDKQSRQKITDFLQFENTADMGDSYDYSPLENDKPILSTLLPLKTKTEKADTYAILTCYHQLLIPHNGDNRLEFIKDTTVEIETKITIGAKGTCMKIAHSLINSAKDQRIRVLLSGQASFTKNYAKQAFGIIEREMTTLQNDNWKKEKYAEIPINIHVLDQFMTITDSKKNQIGIVSRDIKEYQIINQKVIALTLFRSVGSLGKDNLAWRPGRASGVNNKIIYTPDAQMIQKMKFAYSLNYKTNNLRQIDDYENFLSPVSYYQVQQLDTLARRLDNFSLPPSSIKIAKEHQLFTISNEHIIQSVVKKAETQTGYIIRLYNCTKQTQETMIEYPTTWFAHESNLAEKTGKLITNRTVILESNEYKTIKLINSSPEKKN
ncbi:MAG: glycoside hydrolase family 38 C-terminal domain-containing protein [Culicoidibacterales bacterium]